MNTNQDQFFAEILKELKTIAAEVQLIRSEFSSYRLNGSNNQNVSHSEQVTQSLEAMQSVEPIEIHEVQAEEMESLAVSQWLTTRGIELKHYHQQGAADEVFDQLALFLGDHFQYLMDFHENLRRNLSTGNSFSLNLSSKNQKQIANTTQFCAMLNKYAFLSSYKYNKYNKVIYVTPQKIGKVANFFTGGWFERYTFLKISALLSQNGLEFDCLVNPQIVFPNKDLFELDLLFIVNNQPLWVECKTGDYQSYIARYSNTRKQLSVPKERAFLTILGIDDKLADSLTNLYDLTVVNENSFLDHVWEVLEVSESELVQPQELDAPVVTVNSADSLPSNLPKILKSAGLRPLPQIRNQVIEAMISLIISLKDSTSLPEVKSILGEQLSISKNQIQDIFNAVLRGGCLFDDQEQQVMSFTAPFSKIVSDDPVFIERKCLQAYARAVLLSDPDFFDLDQNVAEFEQFINCKISDLGNLDDLKPTF